MYGSQTDANPQLAMVTRHNPENPAEISPTMSWREYCHSAPEMPAAPADFSPAERVVLAHVCRGLSNKEIASALGKSEFTVKHQVSACLTKCGVSSRARLMARLCGLVSQ